MKKHRIPIALPARRGAVFLLLSLALLAVSPGRAGDQGESFEVREVQVGEKLPELTVYTLGGESKKLSRLREDRPALLVTASPTRPVSRRTEQGAEEIARRFSGRLAVFIIYTIEAHPARPTTLAGRLKLVREHRKRVGVSVPVVVDGMENRARQALGGGSNMGVLVDKEGTVKLKQGWLEGPAMARAVEKLLGVAGAAPDARSGATPLLR